MDDAFCKLVQARADAHVWVTHCADPEPALQHIANSMQEPSSLRGVTAGDAHLFILFTRTTSSMSVELFPAARR